MENNNNEKNKNLIIRSSSAEFLIFEQQKKEKGIEVRFEEGDLWLTQKAIGELFDTTRNNITMHKPKISIYISNELGEKSTSKEFLLVQKEGSREVKRKIKCYNLDAVISVGYRVNSDRAIQFRRWTTNNIFWKSYNQKSLFEKNLENYENVKFDKSTKTCYYKNII